MIPPNDMPADTCYCVCHSPLSSRPFCEHCKGDNEAGRHMTADTELQELETLFLARMALTDCIINTSASYIHYDRVVRNINEQIDKLDTLIKELSAPTDQKEKAENE